MNNIGQIGLGRWGSRVAPNYEQLVKEKKIDNFYRYDTITKHSDFGTFDEFIENVDGVHIAVPNRYHYDVAKAVITKGKHVLLEKPMTQDSNSAYDLIELAAEHGVVLQIGYILRFSNVLRKTKELLEGNKLGDIIDCRMEWTTHMQPMHGADIIWDLLPHPLDIMYFLTGQFPISWKVLSRPIRRPTMAEIATILFEYNQNNKRFFTDVKLSWVTPHKKRVVELTTSNAYKLTIECVNQTIEIRTSDGTTMIPVEPNDTIYHEALNFIECIKDGKNRFNSHIIGARNTAIIEQIMDGTNGFKKTS